MLWSNQRKAPEKSIGISFARLSAGSICRVFMILIFLFVLRGICVPASPVCDTGICDVLFVNDSRVVQNQPLSDKEFVYSSAGGGTESNLSVTGWGTNQEEPAVWRDRVVWADKWQYIENAFAYQSDIVLYNCTTGSETRITDTPYNEMSPDIFGNLIVWSVYDPEEGDTDIVLYDLSQGDMTPLTDDSIRQVTPRIWKNLVVWQEGEEGFDSEFGIVLYDVEQGTAEKISLSTPFAIHPAIWEDRVVWADGRNGLDLDIFLFNITTRTEMQVTADPGFQVHPSIWGDMIVWQDDRNGYSQIYQYHIVTGEENVLTMGDYAHEHPIISGGSVVYVNQSDGYDISLIDTTGRDEVLITPGTDSAVRWRPDIWEDRVVWEDGRNGDADIYCNTLDVSLPPLIPGFTQNITRGMPPLVVSFTDTSSGDVHGWTWDFGDGEGIDRTANPEHRYVQEGSYTVILTVHNPWQRASERKIGLISAGTPPVAEFSANHTGGPAPCIVAFTDNATGNPLTWNWSFGDGLTSEERNPVHTYTTPGLYPVVLTVGNDFGNCSLLKSDYITVVDTYAYEYILPEDGITLTGTGGNVTIAVNSSRVAYSFDPLTPRFLIIAVPPDADGHTTVTLISDEAGFTLDGEGMFRGKISRAFFTSDETITDPLWNVTGAVHSLTITVEMDAYDPGGVLRTSIWKGCIPDDSTRFSQISSNFNYAMIEGLACTVHVQREGILRTGSATLIFGIDSDWVRQYGWGDNRSLEIDSVPPGARVYVDTIYAGLTPVTVGNLTPGPHEVMLSRSGYETRTVTMEVRDERDSIHVIRIGDDGTGEVLNTTFIGHDPERNLDFFRAESPHGLSTFGLASLSKSGNVFQMIYLAISGVVGGGGSGGGSTGGNPDWLAAAVKTPTPITTPVQDSRQSPLPTVTSQGDGGTTGSPVPDPTDTIPDGRDQGINPPGVAPWGPATMVLLKNLSVVSVVILVTVVFYLRWKRRED